MKRSISAGCPACGIVRPHQHEGWAWGEPEKKGGPVAPILIPVTPRQRDVLRELVKNGASNQVIAKNLGIEVQSVKTHLKSVMQHLPLVTTRTELALGLVRGTIKTYTRHQRHGNSASYQKGGVPWNKGLPKSEWWGKNKNADDRGTDSNADARLDAGSDAEGEGVA